MTVRKLTAAVIAACCVLLAAAHAAPASDADQVRARVVGTVWMRTAPAQPAGTFRIFLANGTHVTGSCGETYRLDRWRTVSSARISIAEDGVSIPIGVSFSGQEMRLRLRLRNEVRDERYRPARIPYLCR